MAHSSYKLRRAIASVLLLFYGMVGVLGYGLHELFHVHHGHGHNGQATCCCSSSTCSPESDCCSGNDHCHASDETHSHAACDDSHIVVEFRQTEESGDSFQATEHDCAICSFLAQAQEVAAEADSAELVEAVSFGPPASEVRFPLYLPSEHLARGPPNC